MRLASSHSTYFYPFPFSSSLHHACARLLFLPHTPPESKGKKSGVVQSKKEYNKVQSNVIHISLPLHFLFQISLPSTPSLFVTNALVKLFLAPNAQRNSPAKLCFTRAIALLVEVRVFLLCLQRPLFPCSTTLCSSPVYLSLSLSLSLRSTCLDLAHFPLLLPTPSSSPLPCQEATARNT